MDDLGADLEQEVLMTVEGKAACACQSTNVMNHKQLVTEVGPGRPSSRHIFYCDGHMHSMARVPTTWRPLLVQGSGGIMPLFTS